jgi:hypothetical protein
MYDIVPKDQPVIDGTGILEHYGYDIGRSPNWLKLFWLLS